MSRMGDLLVQHMPFMRAVALRLTKDQDRAQDIVQASCVAALESTIDVDDIREPKAWLRSIVRTVVYNDSKRKRASKRAGTLPLFPRDAVVDPAQEAALEVKIALRAVGRLAPRDQEIVLLSAEGHVLSDIGDMLGLSKQRLSQLLQRSRRTIEAGMRYAA